MHHPQHMPRHVRQRRAGGQLRRHVRPVGLERRERADLISHIRVAWPKDPAVDLPQQGRLVIGGAAQHDTVDMNQMRLGLVQRADSAIDGDDQLRMGPLQLVDQRVVEGRDVTVFLGRQALQPGLARMDDKGRNPRRGAGLDQGE